MRGPTGRLVSFLKAEDGPTAVEYAVMLALILLVCFAAITTLGSSTNSVSPTSALDKAGVGKLSRRARRAFGPSVSPAT